MPSNKKQIFEQAKFTYSPLGKVFKNQIKTIEDQEEKQIKAINKKDKLKQSKNMLIVRKMVNWFQNKKKYLINL